MGAIERVLAIDWSGDRSNAARKIWLCEVAGGQVARLECGRSREEIAEHLVAEAARAPRFVVGLDFAFSFPAGFLRKRGHKRVESVWEEAELLGEKWLEHCPSPPFWGTLSKLPLPACMSAVAAGDSSGSSRQHPPCCGV